MAKDTNDIASMRKPYKGEFETLKEDDLVSKEPYKNFKHWFDIACDTPEIMEPNAMAVATASKDGKPSVRMLLLKGFDETGFKFFTNYESRKGKELVDNPHASLLFYWTKSGQGEDSFARQVRVEGAVERLSVAESTEYFHSRPRSSQIGACVSHQSQVISGRQILNEKQSELEKLYADKTIPKPDYWGGFLLRPSVFEFWQGQTNRIHDRIVFHKKQATDAIDPEVTHEGENGWLYERLSP